MDVYAPQPRPVPQRNAPTPTPPTTYIAPVPSLSRAYFSPMPSSQNPGPEDTSSLSQAKPDGAEKPAQTKKPKAATRKKKKSTGKPIGRPPTKRARAEKARAEMGNTSAIEDATDADEAPGPASKKRTMHANKAVDDATDADEAPADGPKKKRAKTTKADWPGKAPLNSAPGSLRVAASTNGSLRTMRPAASGGNGVGASHLQEIPRAPTPVPGQLPRPRGRAVSQTQARRSSVAEFEGSSRFMVSETGIPAHSTTDAVSPSDSAAQSPYNAYTPEESTADIGSSPPVPRSAQSVRSSPPLSSPVLPTMPMAQLDSGFMSGGVDEMIDDYDLPLPSQPLSSTMTSYFPQPKVAEKKGTGRPLKAAKRKAVPPTLARAQTAWPASRATPQLSQNPFARPVSQGATAPISHMAHISGTQTQLTQVPLKQTESAPTLPPPPPPEMIMQYEVPGDPQLLPKETVYTRAGSARAATINPPATGTNGEGPQLKRANTEPSHHRQENPDRHTSLAPLLQRPLEPVPIQPDHEGTGMRIVKFHSHVLPQQEEEQVQRPQLVESEQMERALKTQQSEAQAEAHKPKQHESVLQTQAIQEIPLQEPEGQTLESNPSNGQLSDIQLSVVDHKGQDQVDQAIAPQDSVDTEMDNASNNTVAEQALTPALPMTEASEPVDDTEALLRLLNGPMNDNNEAEPELPSMPTADKQEAHNALQIAHLDTFDPTSMPPAPTSEIGVLDPNDDASASGTQEAFNRWTTKNMSRKKSIKEKLERAVEAGKMPTFCSNCGSISTPTWRKMWFQDNDGSPDATNFSEEPGRITATIILETDEDGKSTKYRTVKKNLLPAEDKSEWTEDILCNREYCCTSDEELVTNIETACGIWLSKYRAHRPESRWEGDKLQKTRDRMKGGKAGKPRPKSKKSKAQGMASAHPTSEAYYTTDPIGPEDQGPSPFTDGEEVVLLRAPTSEPPSRERGVRSQTAGASDSFDASDHRESSESQSNGKGQSPVASEKNGLGPTRRLLFPSPKKDGQLKVLGEVAINIVRTSASLERSKAAIVGKENILVDVDAETEMNLLSTPKISDDENGMGGLFGTPARPSTPPPKARPSPLFKTPTRPTPSHRPITRSVSKSIRRSTVKSPGHTLSQIHQTPTKTPRSSARLRERGIPSASATKISHPHAELPIDDTFFGGLSEFDSPFNQSLHQLLSEANDFTAGSDAHGLGDFELPSDTGGLTGHLEGLDFGHFLTTDTVMPSSPPVMGGTGAHVSFEATELDFSDWGTFQDFGDVQMNEGGDDGGDLSK